ncbi:MAG TPA: helix-turn-helix transcriptional regulator [Caproiciproducens sp.]|nr:helix-turn-helix transcriptional regulator [Caproiciproducens sp.]
MKYEKRLIRSKHMEISNPTGSQEERFPFFVKCFGYCCDRKFSVGNEANLNDIMVLLSLSSVVEFFHHRDVRYLNAYDLVISACHSPLRFNVVGPEKWNFFYLIFEGAQAKYFYNLIRTTDNVMRINPLSRILDVFIDMTETNYQDTLLSYMQQSMLVHDLLYELYKASNEIVECKHMIPAQDTDINNAISFINAHYKEPLSVDIICNKVCLSKFYFCKIFKEHTGISVYQFINQCRINKAKELLSYSKYTVTDIGTTVGFKNTLTFIRNFEKYTHMTPSEYRENF